MKQSEPVQVRAYEKLKRLLGAPTGRGVTPEDRYLLRIAETRSQAAASRQEKKQRRALDPHAKDRKAKRDLTHELDHQFSRFIRARDTQECEDGVRRGHCITCGAYHTYAEFDCGHWIPRKHLATRWHPLNASCQDSGCNRWQHGKPKEFEAKLKALHGEAVINKLLFLKKFGKPPSTTEMEKMIEDFKAKADAYGVPP